MRRGRRLARDLEWRIRWWNSLPGGAKDSGAYKKPGAKPGNWAKIYGNGGK